MNIIKKTITMGDGTIVEIETGKLAKQAAGSVVVKVGGMMLLATVTCAKDAKEDVDFMPLSVEVQGEICRSRPLSRRIPQEGGTRLGFRDSGGTSGGQGPASAVPR